RRRLVAGTGGARAGERPPANWDKFLMQVGQTIVLLIVAAAIAGCRSPESHSSVPASAPLVGTDQVKAVAPLSPEQLPQAAQIYLNKCARCHKPYNPAAYSDSAWQQWVVKMNKKAHLNPEQQEVLVRYRQGLP